MLSALNMGSHGHQSLPFGYDPNGVHGIGLPSFVNQPPPPGQPLLSEQETEQMQDFFTTFDGEHQQHGHPMGIPAHFTDEMAQLQQLQMPQTYVGHETHIRSPQAMDWHAQQMNAFQFGNQINHMSALHTPTSPYGNGHVTSPVHQLFPMSQQAMQTFPHGWQPPFAAHTLPGPRQALSFGTDHDFQIHGYAAPEGPIDADLSLLNYGMAPISSASNTQPNSQPGSNANTEPSSPVLSKKRKLNAFQTEALRMTKNGTTNGPALRESPPHLPSQRKHRKSFVKHEQPPSPLSKTPTAHDDDDREDEDAEYDEDEAGDRTRSSSPPANWSAPKARSTQKTLSTKPNKAKKKFTSSASPAKPKPRRSSSLANNTSISRLPLSAEQKKANHTNSEQRRRDATAKAYADLYDLVPELDNMGKQSTMKKLEVVVNKVQDTKQRLEYLRSMLGRDPLTGHSIAGQTTANQYPGDVGQLHGWQ